MTLSVIIVNYNVKYFLRQCLTSVYGSNRTLADGSELNLDVWVVDNDSVDGSVEMVRHEFPNAHIIENHENTGFAKANNQALAQATGQCLLLLNPDTVVEHDTFTQCVDFMMAHPDCGGLTVKMVDGSGHFLKESKRGFPTPEASFYKITGLIHLFPRSRKVAAYYMGHLPENEVNEIKIMPGAFLMLRREVYAQIGGLDESYFMYGEDIDYSWRIHLAGYKNYYLPTTHIIHYKGESTKKGSANYVYTFYNAMSIFVNHYFNGRRAWFFNLLLHAAIWLRASAAWLRRLLQQLALPAVDFAAAYGGFLVLKNVWITHMGFSADYYPPEYTLLVIPAYILILMASSWLNGGYDRPVRLTRIVSGIATGLVLLLAFYSLLDETQRYSRMLLLIGSTWTLVSTLLIRLLLSLAKVKGYALRTRTRETTLTVGSEEETARIAKLYSQLGLPRENLIATTDSSARHLQDIIRIEHADEVIFCGMDIRHVIELMAELRTTGVEYKIAPSESDYIVGSERVISADEAYLTDLNTITTPTCRRNKRLLDIGVALLLVILSPLLFWFQKHKRHYFGDCFQVLVGIKTWVGYTGHTGVFCPADIADSPTPQLEQRLLLRYMRHYSTAADIRILLRKWRSI
ncbi:MAG: glycosyltransferase [Bacteroidales bacterium]|nr:glycosyltransferase [Bacteroidales bacterium]